tara:strand:- start:159 stop:1670 length:1512 start_codon:yes stop_codon:yes gene_type:complete
MKNLQNLLWLLWLFGSVSLSFSSKAVDCSTDTIGLCSPTVEEIIDEVITETIEHEADGITITTTTDTTTTTTTVTNQDSLDILDGDNDYVVSSKEGDMDIDWGGQGPASMPSGSGCYNLGTDKCAQITGSGNSTSTMGVSGMGTTFINTVDISDLNITHGGRTNYSIKVDKQDSQDSIYMHITGKDGNTNVFSGTDILSASGTNSGYQSYESGFDFSGSITTIIIEVGGRDINLAIGPLFDDVQVQVLYNVINTIVTQQITTVEMFIALNIDTPEEIINVVEDVFEANEPIETDQGFILEPIEIDEPTYETVEIEIEEIEIAEIEIAELEIEAEIETEIEINEIEEPMEEIETIEEPIEETVEEPTEEVEEIEETTEEVEEVEEVKEEPKEKEESKTEPKKEEQKKESSKEKAVKKIMKKIDDKQRYDSANQMKTLIVMQVLGNSKSFFDSQKILNDREGFFTNATLPDTVISDNNIASYYLFVGSEGLMNDMIDSQWQTDLE